MGSMREISGNLQVDDRAQESLKKQWETVSGNLRAEIGEAPYQSWLRPMAVRGLTDGVITISVPTRFMRDWAAAHYQDRLTELWRAENAALQRIEVVVHTAPGSDIQDNQPKRVAQESLYAAQNPKLNEDLCAPLDGRFTFDQFVVGKP
ncbi:MAG: DnaA N-terminal domain-containing protein, partial [Rhodospirillales bacterium]|nr:DnaA N-terminal domain-containing protein [Rhodospirillales bacterium]